MLSRLTEKGTGVDKLCLNRLRHNLGDQPGPLGHPHRVGGAVTGGRLDRGTRKDTIALTGRASGSADVIIWGEKNDRR
jgi:hypothetical protein